MYYIIYYLRFQCRFAPNIPKKKHQSWGDQEIEGPLPFRSLLAGTDCCIVHNDIPGIQQIEDQKKMLKKQNANR